MDILNVSASVAPYRRNTLVHPGRIVLRSLVVPRRKHLHLNKSKNITFSKKEETKKDEKRDGDKTEEKKDEKKDEKKEEKKDGDRKDDKKDKKDEKKAEEPQ